MSTLDALIDPSLRNEPHPTRGVGGVKRKGRGAPPAASSSATDDTTPRTRVTRRQAAAAAAAVTSDPPRTSPGRLAGDAREPTRGEEENRYEWASTSRDNTTTKRSRRMSPSSSPNRQAAGAARDQWAPKGPSSHPRSANGAIGGMDNLAAAAAAAHQSPPASITAAAIAATGVTRPPYPYGLTPFRYPCLTPHLAPPPPGDPANPAFRAFDPNHPTGSVASSVSSPPSVSTRPSSSGAGMPYQSLSTLLAASDSLSRHPSASAPGSRPMSSSGRAVSGSGAASRR